MADILGLVRDFHLNNKRIGETQNELIFGDFAWSKKAKTNYVIFGTDKGNLQKDYYTLECVVYLLKHIDLSHAQYVRQAAAAGVPVVRLPDRKDLLAFLNGETNSAPGIDRAAPVAISLSRPVAKQDSAYHYNETESKRPRLLGESEKVVDSAIDPRKISDDIIGDRRVRLPGGVESASTSYEEAFRANISDLRAKFRAQQQQKTSKGDNFVECGSVHLGIRGPDISTEMGKSELNSALSVSAALDGSLITSDATGYLQRPSFVGQELSQQQQSIISTDDVSLGSTINVRPIEPGVEFMPPGLRSSSFLALDKASVRLIIQRERKWRTRVTVLQSQGKLFYENIVQGILRNATMKENAYPPGYNRGMNIPNAMRTGAGAGNIPYPPIPLVAGSFYPASKNPGQVGTAPISNHVSGGHYPINRIHASNFNQYGHAYPPGSSMALSTGREHGGMSAAPAGPGQLHYSRYDQERFDAGREDDTVGFGIDTMATYHGRALTSMISGAVAAGTVDPNSSEVKKLSTPYPATGIDVDATPITSRIPSNTPRVDNSLQAPSSTPHGVETPHIGIPTNQAANGGITPGGGAMTPRDPRSANLATDLYRGVALRHANEARLSSRPRGRSSRIPIIIIPAAPTSLITMYNARDILQDLKYISSEEKQASGSKRENETLIQRQKPNGRTIPYRVIDQPHKLLPEEWNRVVAVFVQGQAWQFKGWPMGPDPATIFSMIKGFHLKHTNMPLDPNVAKWNVRVINLDRRRHMDRANFQQIWDTLDKHIAKHKSFLRA